MEKEVHTSCLEHFQKMCCGVDNLKVLCIKFNTTYCIAKQERPYCDYHTLLGLQQKNRIEKIEANCVYNRAGASFICCIPDKIKLNLSKELAPCKFCLVLSDRSADSAAKKQEFISNKQSLFKRYGALMTMFFDKSIFYFIQRFKCYATLTVKVLLYNEIRFLLLFQKVS